MDRVTHLLTVCLRIRIPHFFYLQVLLPTEHFIPWVSFSFCNGIEEIWKQESLFTSCLERSFWLVLFFSNMFIRSNVGNETIKLFLFIFSQHRDSFSRFSWSWYSHYKTRVDHSCVSCGLVIIQMVNGFTTGAPNESIVQNHLNIALLNVF